MLGALSRLFRKPPSEPSWVEVAELRDRLAAAAPPLMLDVRGPDEFEGPLGHIEGALNIPLPELGAHVAAITAAGRPVVCVCLTDMRSSAAAHQLTMAGLADVAVLRGGMKAWNAQP
jgi:rhodanese-related sulfurtransferase